MGRAPVVCFAFSRISQLTKPWRRYAADYSSLLPSSVALTGVEAEAEWDADLVPVMKDAGYSVPEEQVLDRFLPDLRVRRGSR
jgi:hypothetical protein